MEAVIFDVDGTLYDTRDVSIRVVKECLQEAEKRHGAVIGDIPPENILALFGETPENIAKKLLPEDFWYLSREILDCIESREVEAIQNGEGKLFPGVLETLEELNKRGYVLGIYSNGPTDYFRTILETRGISPLVDFSTCIGEHPYLQKPGLLALVKNGLGVRRAAVVGDRHHDIEAARATKDVAIGAGYGFGGDEVEEADAVVQSFPELLELLPYRTGSVD